MSTRANVIIKGGNDELYFYRHSDGYPECCGEDLKNFVESYKLGVIRDNVMQSAGWLIVRGHFEYLREDCIHPTGKPTLDPGYGWKVGAYEPTSGLHGDVEYIYVIDLDKKTLTCREPIQPFWDEPTLKNTVASKQFKPVKFAPARPSLASSLNAAVSK